MNIFVLSQGYPDTWNIQRCVFVHEQCKKLQAMGHQVTVLDAGLVTWRRWMKESSRHIVHRTWDGIDVYTFNGRAFATTYLLSMNQTTYIRRAMRVYSHVKKKIGLPDLIYAHFAAQAGVAACRIRLVDNVPVVIIEHGGAVMKEKHSFFMEKVLKLTVMNADAFMCVSKQQKQCIEKYVADCKRITVVPNMIDDRFHYEPRIPKNRFVFFSAGNLVKVKRMDMLIRAFATAFRREESVQLRVAGDGAEKENLLALISKLGLEKQVYLIGRIDREMMFKEYVNCDVFALASEHESFGIAYREALAVGRPVLATENGGIREGWKDSFGYVCRLNDEEHLARMLRTVYETYDTYNLKQIAEDCAEFCASDRVMQKIEGVLEEVCGKIK